MSLRNLDVSVFYEFPEDIMTLERFTEAIKWDINHLLPPFIDNMYKMGYDKKEWNYADWLECFLAWAEWIPEESNE